MVIATAPRAIPARPRTVVALTLLLGAQFVGVGGLFPLYAFAMQESAALRVFALALAALALASIVGVWQQRPWALWATLAVAGCKLTVDLFNWSLALDRRLLPLSEAINLGIIALVFILARDGSSDITRAQRIFYGFVLALAAFVAFWGLGVPQRVDSALPFPVPALHARFLGAMYLSGAVFVALGIAARAWPEVRVMTPMIAVWTGALGFFSLLHLDQFDWTRGQTWVWFIAYTAYPLIAAWMTWRQRGTTASPPGPPLAAALRGYLIAQGILVTALALGLLLAAPLLVRIWPWPISITLAHLYAAPFLSYGLGSLYAARQRVWAEVRVVIYGTLVFALGVLIASFHHRALFRFDRPAVWLWFGGFGLASLVLALSAGIPLARTLARSRATAIGPTAVRWPDSERSSPVVTVAAAAHRSPVEKSLETPIWWPLRAWMVIEVGFGLLAILTIFLAPQDTATNFAWPIKPDVMAATLGAFYLSTALLFVLPLFARTWQSIRAMIVPTAAFTATMLLTTFLHWDKFSVGTAPFYVWFASYLLPPPIFAALYWWHQRRSAPPGTGVSWPVARWLRAFLCGNGALVTGSALLLYFAPSLLQRIAPWQFTPLTVRALCGWLIGIGLLQVWLAWEGDWARMRLGTIALILLPSALTLQLARFPEQVRGETIVLRIALADCFLVASLLLGLWVLEIAGRRGIARRV